MIARKPSAVPPPDANAGKNAPRIVDFQVLFAALDEATLCLPRALQTDDADTIVVGMRLQAVRLEALRLYQLVMSERTTRRVPKRKRT